MRLRPIALLCFLVAPSITWSAEPVGTDDDAALGPPRICREPPPTRFRRGTLAALNVYDPGSGDSWQCDLRSCDASGLDLSKRLDDLLHSSFDDRTIWPPQDRLPRSFYRDRIMDLGKNPGLHVRTLHKRGITGRGVGLAIIDQTLLVRHDEYADRLRFYDEYRVRPGIPAQMHGLAVASIAVGRTCGVAPEADLYYISSWTYDPEKQTGGKLKKDFTFYAECVRRILKLNAELPRERRIRVISMQVGWTETETGYADITAAVHEAIDAGMLVVSSSIERTHGFRFHGLGRHPLSDPDAADSYEPGGWWARQFYGGADVSNRLLVPMDSRAVASPTGDHEYAFYREGGWSWSIPYIAGLYALAAQVDPAVTPDRFWELAMKTGRTVTVPHDGREYSLGPIVDPVALMGAVGGS